MSASDEDRKARRARAEATTVVESVEPQPDARHLDVRPLDVRPLDARPLDARALDARPLDARQPEARQPDAPQMRAHPSSASDEGPSFERIGRFTILHKIAAGGMGVVHAAHDEKLDRTVAIKLLHPRADRDEEAHGRMMREARAMARLSHPNVVQVHDVGEVEGQVFVAMEYVQGLTLRRWLKAEPRSWRDVLEIFRQAGQGLAAAHEAGIIHRDFKPDNVIVGKDRRVKVLDFGLARWHDPELQEPEERISLSGDGEERPSHNGEEASLTKTGFVIGTPAYMSPEQHEGFPADARSDQFSFCVALYEALYGRRPFPGRNFDQVARAILEDDPLPPPGGSRVPKWLHRVVMRGLSRDPSRRFPSMASLLSAFEDFQARVDARNANMLRLETGLGSVLVGAFWILDWLFIPEHIWLTGLLRGAVCAYAVGIYLLCRQRPRLVERRVDELSITVNVAAGWSIAAITWLQGGLESPYYAGLNLLVLCIGIMFLWRIRTALLVNGLIYVFYMSPLWAGFLPVVNGGEILMNQFFLVSTIIITVSAQHQRFAFQRREFLAEQERRELREEVAAMTRGGQRPVLHDRAEFLVLAEDELQRSRRYGRPMACIVMGIDGFAEINAQYDDSVGDELLHYVAQSIVKDIRQFDLVGKYHADEFVFLLPETRPENAHEVAQRLVDKLGHRPVATRAGLVDLTLSAGVSALETDVPDLRTLLSRAIAALEQAKRNGGSRTLLWVGEHMISTLERSKGGGSRPRRSSGNERRRRSS